MTKKVIPDTQYAVQLVGPSELTLNKNKEVHKPGPTQILARVEAVGLCFSDLKLLKQFDAHARKSEIVSGMSKETLAEIPSYASGQKPTVPGHEAVCIIVAVGDEVKRHKVGERVLVQTDYRELKTAKSNAAFGYNFEGALQEYVLMDERVVIDPISDERFLIPASGDLSASAIALIEPWACVEDSYITSERNTIKAGGRLLLIAEAGRKISGLSESFSGQGGPESITVISKDPTQIDAIQQLGLPVRAAACIEELSDASFDDIVYLGADKATVEFLGSKLANQGVFNVVTAGGKFAQPITIDVGRVHYGMTRWCGTTSENIADGYKHIPQTGEIRDGEKLIVVGAAGPMGQMHVIRNLCLGKKDVTLIGTDFDSERLKSLAAKAEPLAAANDVDLQLVNPQTTPMDEKFSYIALMAPVAPLVAKAIEDSSNGCLINIFAGIPAGTLQELDLDTYIANQCWMFGTSGSTIEDMKIVLKRTESGQLNTNCSADAISGMAGAIDGIAAVENRTLAGKIIVYPALKELDLMPLTQLKDKLPAVASKLENGMWTKASEDELLSCLADR